MNAVAQWEPLWPLLEPEIRRRQPERFRWPRETADCWIGPLHSPLREDRHPSFSVRPDSATDPGAWKDHGTGEHGSIADLAGRLGIDPRQSAHDETPKPVADRSLEGFCQQRGIRQETLDRFRVRETRHGDRPALRFPTKVGVDRIKFLDGVKPKCTWAGRGGRAHWYGLGAARELLSEGGTLYLVNGEPSVWAAIQSGVPAVCTCAGEGDDIAPELVAELVKASMQRVAVVYDLDKTGPDGARKAARALRAGGLEAVALELPAELGYGGDLDDLHRCVGDNGLAAALAELPELPADAVEVVADEWPGLGELPAATPPVPHLPPELLPEPVQPYLADAAERASLPLEMVAVPWLVVTAAAIGRGVGIKPGRFDGWTVVPNLWGGIVAPPGALKTHAITVGTRLLSPLIDRARREHEEASAEAEIERARVEQALKRLTTGRGAATADPAEIAELRRELRDLERVPERRYRTSDATVEKLGELLRDTPRGLLLTRDELAGWLRTLDRPGREGDREFYLESWNGDGSYTVDRIGRGTVHIPALCVSVLGGVQPGKLARYVSEAVSDGAGADGLLQRLQVLVWPDDLGKYHVSRGWQDGGDQRRCVEILERLADLDPGTVGAERGEFDDLPVVRWSPQAQELFDAWRGRLEHRLRGGELVEHPAFASYVGKQRSFMPSLALILDLVERVAGLLEPGVGVSLHAARRAAALVEFFEAHARKVYAVELEPGRVAAGALARRIKAGDIGHEHTVRDIVRAEWSGLTSPDVVRAGLEALKLIGWCRVTKTDSGSKGGRPSEVVELHPTLRRTS